MANERRRWDPDAGIVFIVVCLAIMAAVMLWFINQPTP